VVAQDEGSPGRTSRIAVLTALAVVYVVWGSTYLAIRFAVETLPPFLMSGSRFLVAGVILYAWVRLRRIEHSSIQAWKVAAGTGLLMLLGGAGGVAWAEQRVASGPAALVVASTPLWMVLFDALRSGGRWPGAIPLMGVGLGFAGMAVLIFPLLGPDFGVSIDLLGATVLVVAAISWSLGSVYSQSAGSSAGSALQTTALQMLTGGLSLVLVGLVVGEWRQLGWMRVSVQSIGAWGYLTVMGSLVAFSAYVWLLQVAPIPLVSSHAFVNPLVAVVLGTALGQEPLTSRVLLATTAIAVAVLMTSTAKKPSGD
jgi:drug/metabolite transporter (DMT)-like permease